MGDISYNVRDSRLSISSHPTKTKLKSYTKNEENRDRLIEEINSHLTHIHKDIGPEKFSPEQLNNYRNYIYDKAKQLNISDATVDFVYKLIFSLDFAYSPQNHVVTWKTFLNLTKLLCLYLTDNFASILLCCIYLQQQHWNVFGLTLSVTLINSVLVSQVTMSNRRPTSTLLHYICKVFNLYTIFSIWRALTLAWNLKWSQTIDPEDSFNNLEDERSRIERVKYYTGFFKCVPFLIMQIIVFYIDYRKKLEYDHLLQLVPFVTSFFGAITAIFSRFKSPDLSNLWVISILAARLCCIILIASIHPKMTITVLICHWVLGAVWYLFKVLHQEVYSNTEKLLFSINEGIISGFVPINFLNLNLNTYLFIIHFLENLAVISVWYLQEEVTASNYFLPYVIMMDIVYYLFGLICFISLKESDSKENQLISDY